MVKHAWMVLAVLALACGPGQERPEDTHDGGTDAGEQAPDASTDAGDQDTDPPDDIAPLILDLTVTPVRAASGDEIRVRFGVDEAVGDVTVLIGVRPASCDLDGAATYACAYFVEGDEPEGEQHVVVEATDVSGNSGAASAAVSFDFTAPTFTHVSQQPSDDGAHVALEFTTEDAGEVHSTCAVNDAAAEPCVSPFTTPALPDGPHTVLVTATDDVGNASTASVPFTISTAPPDTSLVVGIPALSNVAVHGVEFTSNDPEAIFECRLEPAPFAPCTSPHEVHLTQDGPGAFEVRAVNGRGQRDPTPARNAFVLDRIAPTTTIDPIPESTTGSAEVVFRANEDGTISSCAVDSESPVACTSPLQLTGLLHGLRTVRIHSVDAAGNVGMWAQRSFYVDTMPPETTLYGPSIRTSETDATLRFSSNKQDSSFRCSLNGAAWSTCRNPVLLTGLAEGHYSFSVYAVDRHGRPDFSPATTSWDVDLTPPRVAFDPISPTLFSPDIRFNFYMDEPGWGFCSLNGAPYEYCKSPIMLYGLHDTVTNGESPHVFSIRARDTVGHLSDPYSVSLAVDLAAKAPGEVRLVAPNPPRTTDPMPTFQWEGGHADTYDFELSTDPSFEDPQQLVRSLYDSPSTTYQSGAPLAPGRYHVRLRGRNAVTTGEYSNSGVVQVVTTNAPPPGYWPLQGADCRSATECIMVGERGLILSTPDGGETLTHAMFGATSYSPTLHDVAYVDDSADAILFAVGDRATLLRSANRGMTWAPIHLSYSSLALDMVHFKNGRGLVLGQVGHFVTVNGGRFWKRLDQADGWGAPLDAAVVATDDSDPTRPVFTALVIDDWNRVHRTHDAGETWNWSSLPSPGCRSISFFDELHGFIGCDDGIVLRTGDGGVTWQTTSHPAGLLVRASGVVALSPTTAFVAYTPRSPSSEASNVYAVSFGDEPAVWMDGVRAEGDASLPASISNLVGAGNGAFAVGEELLLVEQTTQGPLLRQAPGWGALQPLGP